MPQDNWLAHYGVPKQKWGVRHYQNPDGSLTEEGKRHYKVRSKDLSSKESFKNAESSVKKNLSNKYDKVDIKPVNLETVMSRGQVTESEAKECVSLAEKIFRKAVKAEPEITGDVVDAVSEAGCSMYGLENRLKQPTSLAAKIGADAKEKDVSFEVAADRVRDAIRYTSVSDEQNYVQNYYTIRNQLEQQGYSELRCKNFFEAYKEGKAMHKSVQSVFSDEKGNVFELQFQTPASQAAKDLKLPIYEERRKSGISEQRKRDLERQMVVLAERVNDPKDVFSIMSFG